MSLSQLSRRRWRVAGVLSALVALVYFTFILSIAFDKPLLARLVAPGLSLGIVLGVLVIAVTWISTWLYVRWANEHFDPGVQALRSGGEKP